MQPFQQGDEVRAQLPKGRVLKVSGDSILVSFSAKDRPYELLWLHKNSLINPMADLRSAEGVPDL